jgi:hypothetical protein
MTDYDSTALPSSLLHNFLARVQIMDLPPLPHPIHVSGVWPDHLHQAYDTLCHIYCHAFQAIQAQSELHHIQFHAEVITNDAVPLLQALENSSVVESIPMPWVLQVTIKIWYITVTAARSCNNSPGTVSMSTALITMI